MPFPNYLLEFGPFQRIGCNNFVRKSFEKARKEDSFPCNFRPVVLNVCSLVQMPSENISQNAKEKPTLKDTSGAV